MVRFSSLFKPTPLFKELMILNLIANEKRITQRKISNAAGISTSMVNSYLEDYANKGLIDITYSNSKNVHYKITKKGEEERKLLNIQYLESALDFYNSAKTECLNYLKQIISKGHKNILFYGAGEVAEIMLYVINNSDDIDINILAIIDDDINKQGKKITNINIISFNDISNYNYDGIMISTYTNTEVIYQKLINNGIDEKVILQFFDEN